MAAIPKGKIAFSPSIQNYLHTDRDRVPVQDTTFTDVSAVVLSEADIDAGLLDRIQTLGYGIPVFAVSDEDPDTTPRLKGLTGVLAREEINADYFGRMVEVAAHQFDHDVLPPFFRELVQYERKGYAQFDCPGHQGGQFFQRHPAGRRFYDFYGENLFRTDLCNADVKMGDLLIHEGPPKQAEMHAARVFNADYTYLILNGTSTSNKIALSAILTPGDLVLFDRNNHKSVHHGALFLSQATPIYLETARNAYGLIGGIDEHCFEENYIRERIARVDPERARAERPIRMAIIQLGTYDGTIYNARQVVDRIGKLCDYILFDSAWVGYEQFIPMMSDCSPLLLDLKPDDPGIIVTQSVHKQQAGFSQASQIHKKDAHIEGEPRHVNADRFNNAYMMHYSTSPFYPMFAALDVNAKMHADGSGEKLWAHAVRVGVEARKMILRQCSMIRPFVPKEVHGRPWEEAPTEEIIQDRAYFAFDPEDDWHGFEGYQKGQYFVDPNKLLLTTPGLKAETFDYEDFGIPANILANYLRDNNIINEKADLNSILFLMTPAELITKMQNLVATLIRFEEAVQEDQPLARVLPGVYEQHSERYQGYTIRRLCQEMHDFYKDKDVKRMQKDMFRERHFPPARLPVHEANWEFQRGNVELVPLTDISGRICAEGALPYPPGIICVIPGEQWTDLTRDYFLTLEEGINLLPGFAPELQGVHLRTEANGRIRAYGYVLKN
ncbi:ornithine decarboxylase [Alcanivorax sp. 521-1]|uniref:Ornithine decarboxylase n=1 Tax=Alloalcanivorax profundimaris TaxID=2735259 RepID=A0ABS0ARH9_9GAMM|nr:ornithine decarboxylase [Alloalcanivorax profundimaris]MBF5056708.1 ornithine decarboxylase [Alloalcanivorax profundimaris]